jgi:DNA processing protein
VGEVHYSLVKNSSTQALAEEVYEASKKKGVDIIPYTTKDYPHRLKNCIDSPMVVYFDGDKESLKKTRVVSIVGTRNATRYGVEFTEQFVKRLLERDVLVVSGLAYGIDAAAHRATLKFNGSTVGVVAHGLDRVSPTQHKSLAEKMKVKGGLLSEHRLGVKIEKGFFPMRNRLVAGMADATIVMESDIRGGSLITAYLANDYSRDVFALPGRVGDQFSRGCNMLIQKNVAHILNDVDEFFRMMGWEEERAPLEQQIPLFVELEGREKQVFSILDREPKTVDKISMEAELPMSQVSSTLLALEFKGLVKALPGKQYAISNNT